MFLATHLGRYPLKTRHCARHHFRLASSLPCRFTGRVLFPTKHFTQSKIFCQHRNISAISQAISTKLGHNNKFMKSNPWHDQHGVKMYMGVTGVKNVISEKNTTPPTIYIALPWYSCIWNILRPFTKVMGQKIELGSFGVSGVKSFLFPKKSIKCYFSYISSLMITWFINMM